MACEPGGYFPMSELMVAPTFLPAEPLSNFMVLIPGLVKKPQHLIQATVEHIQIVFADFKHVVVFAELNLKLSLLWVSVKPVPGVRFQISEALRAVIPEARLVSHI